MPNTTSILKLVFLLGLLINPFGSSAVVSPVQEIKPETQKTNKILSRKDIEKKLGRKLKFKERISFWILKKKLQKASSQNTFLPTLGMIFSFISITPYIGLLFGLLGFLLGVISFFFVKKSEVKKKYKKRAWIAIITSVVITTIHLALILALR